MIGQNLPVARKREKVDNELQGGSLSHNPFASLLGGKAAGASSQATRAPQPTPPVPSAKSSEPSQKVVVRFEAKGHGGKTVTRISGLPGNDAQLAQIARSLKKAMGSGARVEDGDVLVQGKLVDRVLVWLKKNGEPHVVRGN